MNIHPHAQRIAGILIFALGVLSSTLLTSGLAWAGLEASLYGFPRYTEERFDGLACPPLMTRGETSFVLVTVRNPSAKIITPIITVDLSSPGLPDSSETQVTVEAGQSRQLGWAISAENIDLYRFILAKANRSPSYPLPTAEAVCGTFVLEGPSFLNGMQILSLWLALCLVCIPLGLWMWRLGLVQPARTPSIATALAVAALLGLTLSLNGLWMLAVLALAVTILLTLGLIPR